MALDLLHFNRLASFFGCFFMYGERSRHNLCLSVLVSAAYDDETTAPNGGSSTNGANASVETFYSADPFLLLLLASARSCCLLVFALRW